jgi:hypothetical protein
VKLAKTRESTLIVLMRWKACCLLALCATTGEALAAEPLQLSFSSPHDCGSAAAVSQKLDETLPAAKTEGWRASVDITRVGPERLSLRVRTDGPETQSARTLEVDTCAAAVRAAALLIVLAIDPMAVSAEDAVLTDSEPADPPSPPEQTEPPPPAPKEETVRETPTPSSPSRQRTPTQLTVSAMGAGLGHWGETAALAFGATLGARARYGRLSVLGAGSWLAERESDLDAPNTRLATSALGVHGELGWELGHAPLHFGPHVGMGMRRVQAQALGISEPRPAQSSYWSHLRAGVSMNVELSKFLEVFSNVSAVIPLQPPTYSVEGLGEVHQAEALGLDLQLGVFWRLNPQ